MELSLEELGSLVHSAMLTLEARNNGLKPDLDNTSRDPATLVLSFLLLHVLVLFNLVVDNGLCPPFRLLELVRSCLLMLSLLSLSSRQLLHSSKLLQSLLRSARRLRHMAIHACVI